MIGVISQANERDVIEEFFQLFKTPWEFFREGRPYDVVVVTGDDVPELDAKVVFIYGAELKNHDPAAKLTACAKRENVVLDCHGSRLPLYGTALIFEKSEGGVPCITADAGIVGLRIRSVDCTVL